MGGKGIEMEDQGRLEIDDGYERHLRAWKVKRVAWGGMLLVILAGLGGCLGPGPFSKTSVRGPGGLFLEFERIARYNAPTRFRVVVPPGKEDLEISINASFLQKIDLERIDPEPKEMRIEGNEQTWVFTRKEGAGDSVIQIRFRPDGFGFAVAKLDFANFGSIEIKPFFLP